MKMARVEIVYSGRTTRSLPPFIYQRTIFGFASFLACMALRKRGWVFFIHLL